MAEKVNYVAATIMGATVRLSIPREFDTVRRVEMALGSGIYGVMQRLVFGAWTQKDVVSVLVMATPAGRRSFGIETGPFDRAIQSNGVGIYAVLAQLVLEAHLFGLDPALAVFDDSKLPDRSEAANAA